MLADAVPYAGQTIEGRRVVLDVRGRVVVRVRAGLEHYGCATFGDVGPMRVDEAASATIGSDGRFRFTAGEPAERVTVTGRRAAGGRIDGTLKVVGTIATGQRCASATLRFSARR